MGKLLKYEFRKTWKTKVILLGITAVAEIAYLIMLYSKKNDSIWALGATILFFIAFGGIMAIGLESIITLHRDMNTKQSYMLFMTPNSSYSILGAKILETSLSILAAGAFFFALGAADISLLLAKHGMLNELWQFAKEFITSFNENIQIDTQSIAVAVLLMLCGWISVICMVFLADVISSALLYGRRYNGLVSFIVFILLSTGTSWVSMRLVAGISEPLTAMLTQSAIELGFAALMYIATTQIMERKLSV